MSNEKAQGVFVIAEVGSVHDGSFGKATKLIETAAICALPMSLAHRGVLWLVTMEAAVADPLGILRGQLPGYCATCIDHQAPPAVLR